MKISITIPAFFLAATLASCSKFMVLQSRVEYPWEKKYKLANRTAIKSAALPGFQKIWLAGDFDVDVVLRNADSIRIEGDENLVSRFKYEVSGGELLLHYADVSKGTKEKLKVVVACRSLVAVSKLGKGTMRFLDEFTADRFVLKQSGSGKAYVKLQSDQLHLKQVGSGEIQATGHFSSVQKRISGSGKLLVNGHE